MRMIPRPDLGETRSAQILAIVQAVTKYFGLASADEIRSICRERRYCWPRQVSIHLQTKLLGACRNELAEWWTLCPSNITYSVQHVADMVATDPECAREVFELLDQLRSPHDPEPSEALLA